MVLEKIITHAGQFHADELLAIATVESFIGGKLPIERKFQITQEENENPYYLILDIGGKFQPNLGNFDHHQDGMLHATNMLVLHRFCSEEIFPKLCPFYRAVSDVDTGRVPGGGDVAGWNAVIRRFNSLPNGFDLALDFTRQMLDALIASAKEAIAGEARWADLPRTHGGKLATDESGSPIVGWNELAATDGVLLLSHPNPRSGWQLTSSDSKVFVIPETDTQTFRHNSGFMAVYATREDAEVHAAILLQAV